MRLLLASQRLRQAKGFKNPLTTLLRQAMPKTTKVQAAVAYVSRRHKKGSNAKDKDFGQPIG